MKAFEILQLVIGFIIIWLSIGTLIDRNKLMVKLGLIKTNTSNIPGTKNNILSLLITKNKNHE